MTARWTRSLRTKWALALVAVCLVEAGLVAVAMRAGTEQAFEEFLVEEAHAGLVMHVTRWVQETGSIDGFVPPGRRDRPRPEQRLREPRPRPQTASPGAPTPASVQWGSTHPIWIVDARGAAPPAVRRTRTRRDAPAGRPR